MTERVLMAGFGGQGIMLLGKLVAKTAMEEGLEVTFFPSYGAEVRGGTANCHVIMSDEPIHSPIVERADSLIIMNQPSYDRFRPLLKSGGQLVVNSSMAALNEEKEGRLPAATVCVPATELANELGNVRVANMLMLGAYAALWRVIPEAAYMRVIEEDLGHRKAHLLAVNRQAYRKGFQIADGRLPNDRRG